MNIAFNIQVACFPRIWNDTNSTLAANRARVLFWPRQNCLPTFKIYQLQLKPKVLILLSGKLILSHKDLWNFHISEMMFQQVKEQNRSWEIWEFLWHTLGKKSSVRYTALEFNSDMVNGGSSSVWKYLSPRAIPITIFMRRVQLNWHPSPSAAK